MTEGRPILFLWGQRFPEPPVEEAPPDGNWWRQYSERLTLTPSALTELSESSRRLMSLLPSSNNPNASLVRGAVVGAVQSGKTAHMIALTARALDAGYNCVVVLAGMKDDLRAQTARRFNVQLLRQRDPLAGSRDGFTMTVQQTERRVEGLAPPYFLDCHQWALFHIKLGQAFDRGIPVVAVIKKNKASLASMRERIRQAARKMSPRKLALLVLDDECDEASVEPNDETPTPELIANLWRLPEQSVSLSYVGYTATVAANLLQKPDNDLYPDDFVFLLRSPAARDSALTFREPSPHAWYCGGHAFYESFIRPVDGGSSLLVEPIVTEAELRHSPAENGSLKQAIRVFLVGAAFRHLEHPEWTFEDPRRHPAPHTMIVQASTAIADHVKFAEAIRAFIGIQSLDAGASSDSLESDFEHHPQRWADAVSSLEQSRMAVNEVQPHPWPLRQFDWDKVWEEILSLAPHVRIRVLNSGPESIDALEFESPSDGHGTPLLPSDLLSIIVGGGRLSRGLTIEGLSVSYFSRRADVPVEDTILQLSRWYGYRGRHLDYCRVFTTDSVAGELTWIHRHDQEMRSRLASLVEERTTPRRAGLVLASVPRGLPTAKLGVGKLKDVSYSPWCRALDFVEIGDEERNNETVAVVLAQKVAERKRRDVLTRGGTRRGIVSEGWPVEEILEVLESMRFSKHNPDETIALLGSAYRRHDSDRKVTTFLPEEIDPYAVAAYLRVWRAQATKDRKHFPTFNVGVAYGTEHVDVSPFEYPLANREISAAGFVNGGWVGRSENWDGDQFFDGIASDNFIGDSPNRREGAPGLLLLYVIHKDSVGRRGNGVRRTSHSPMFGISVPAGGPPFRRVLLEPSHPA